MVTCSILIYPFALLLYLYWISVGFCRRHFSVAARYKSPKLRNRNRFFGKAFVLHNCKIWLCVNFRSGEHLKDSWTGSRENRFWNALNDVDFLLVAGGNVGGTKRT